VVELGSHEELMGRHGLYHAMVSAHEHDPAPDDLPDNTPPQGSLL
jgi:hypothetical protein